MKRFNFNELVWFIILILLDLALVYLIITGKIELYIEKKMIKYIYITIFMLSIMAMYQINNVFTPKGNDSIIEKIVPMLLVLIIGTISINSQGTFKHMELNKELTEDSQYIDLHNHGESKLNKQINKTTEKQQQWDVKSINEPIVINDDNPMVLEDIKLNSENYIDKQIEVHGFVCKESYLNKNQFIIGRIVMSCYAADSQVVGIIGEWEKAADLVENQWVYVKGTISYSTINDDDGINHRIPIIRIDKLEVEKNHNN